MILAKIRAIVLWFPFLLLVHNCDRILYSNHGMINSPGFPGLYRNNFNSCLAEIIGPPGSVIVLDFVSFSVEANVVDNESFIVEPNFGGNESCPFDKVEVMDHNHQLILTIYVSAKQPLINVWNYKTNYFHFFYLLLWKL